MGSRITWWEDCPKCGGKDTVECYEAYSCQLKYDSCNECDYFRSYTYVEHSGDFVEDEIMELESGK